MSVVVQDCNKKDGTENNYVIPDNPINSAASNNISLLYPCKYASEHQKELLTKAVSWRNSWHNFWMNTVLPGYKAYPSLPTHLGRFMFNGITNGVMALVKLFPQAYYYIRAAVDGDGRFERIEKRGEENLPIPKQVRIISLNSCVQAPYSTLSGGVPSPMSPIGSLSSRVDGIARYIIKQDPHVFIGQELEDPVGQMALIEALGKSGFSFVIRDLGANHPIFNHSGLFIASRIPIKREEFVQFPLKDRAGGQNGTLANKGALGFVVDTTQGELTIVNTHLNAGNSKSCQEARRKQMQKYVVPLAKRKGNFVIAGDVNFDTENVSKQAFGLEGLENATEGLVTCTDEPKHLSLGKSKIQDGKPCGDCVEKLDAVIHDPNKIKISDVLVEPVMHDGQYLTDHYAVNFTAEIVT